MYDKRRLTFGGIKCPQIVDPSAGVKCGKPTGTGGYILNASLTQAFRYGRPARTSILMASEVVNAFLISCTSLFIASGVVSSMYVSPLSNVAVVSVPATMKSPAFTSISALGITVSPFSSSCLRIRSQRSTPSDARPFSSLLVTRVALNWACSYWNFESVLCSMARKARPTSG